jgi:hypothetical protein
MLVMWRLDILSPAGDQGWHLLNRQLTTCLDPEKGPEGAAASHGEGCEKIGK